MELQAPHRARRVLLGRVHFSDMVEQFQYDDLIRYGG